MPNAGKLSKATLVTKRGKLLLPLLRLATRLKRQQWDLEQQVEAVLERSDVGNLDEYIENLAAGLKEPTDRNIAKAVKIADAEQLVREVEDCLRDSYKLYDTSFGPMPVLQTRGEKATRS
jgi:hypothetical protein